MDNEKTPIHGLPLWRCNRCGLTAGAIGYAMCPRCKILMQNVVVPDNQQSSK